MRSVESGYGRAFRPIVLVLVLVLCGLLLAGPAAAMKNPSAVYCEALGYKYVTVTAQDGGMKGFCQLSPGEQVSAWKFLQGETAQEKSYCAKQGLPYKKVSDPVVCKAFGLDTCMVCISPDGKETEVTALMNLSFEEGICGDGICAMSENSVTCPGDCPRGGADGYCESVAADPDCGSSAETGSAVRQDWLPLTVIGIIVLVIIAAAAYLVMRKKAP